MTSIATQHHAGVIHHDINTPHLAQGGCAQAFDIGIVGHVAMHAIAAALAKAQTKRAERCELTGDMVLDELRKIGFANMADYMRPTPEGHPMLDFSGLTRDQTAALSQVTVEDITEGKRVQFRLHDKLGALDKLGRHLGLFGAKHTQAESPVDHDPP
jgi:hypothetical protein